MASKHCPICQKEVAPRTENPSFPFCSKRCRAVDLGKWLGEEYRIAATGAVSEAEEDELPPEAKKDDHDHWGDA